MLPMQSHDGRPDLSIPVDHLTSLLKDNSYPSIHYPRYRDWVMYKIWEAYCNETERQPIAFGWRGNPDFNALTCWLYVQWTEPDWRKHFDDTDFDRDHIVWAFLIKSGRAIAAVRINPWWGRQAHLKTRTKKEYPAARIKRARIRGRFSFRLRSNLLSFFRRVKPRAGHPSATASPGIYSQQ